ncbi:hypothetical protein CDD81_1382 [Ophiocordyceps australis]|uniref:Nuclear pore protein n=1 Tax=Ophiocordyceps australis TaxID=1399860 RepID=A0A2C5Y174_9HYPO|nr:hypothetical protein CDD81_1382 [Ophiocordyceps australis]
MSVFGQPSFALGGLGQNQQMGSGLMGASQASGQQTQTQQQQGSLGAGAGGASATANSGESGLFGLFGGAKQDQQQQNQQQQNQQQQNQQQQNQQQQSQQQQSQQPQQQPQSQQANTVFGANTAFGSLNQQPQQNANPMFGGSSLGGGLLGASGLAPASQSHQPAGAYFDSLFAKTQKNGGARCTVDDLPTLELGLGDLRHRLRKLQSQANEKLLDGKAHYLLAASGVDPSVAARDLGMLDVKGGRVERAHGYAPTEIDVETYITNLQSKTTLDMINDSMTRSARNFDKFLQDHISAEWDDQRKRIYEHFGIKAPQEAAPGSRESQFAFGRSRRSKSQGGPSRAGRSTVFGSSALQRSVIGTPSRIGAHESEFADVDTSADGVGALRSRSVTEDRTFRDRQSKLAEKVRGLNAARLSRTPYAIFAELAQVEQKSHEVHAPHVVEAYRALVEIVGELPSAEAALTQGPPCERQFAKMYLDENTNSIQAVEMRRRILRGSTQFLEQQFMREVELLIAKFPHEAKLGGLPDVKSKIKAYIRLRATRRDLVPDKTELQQLQGEYVWAVIFYLLRAGQIDAAVSYVEEKTTQLRGIDRMFATYLNLYAASGERRITNRQLQDRCTNEFIQRSRSAQDKAIDPFRMACYKVLGRVELSNRNLDGLTTDINDWIWLQFTLAREGDKSLEMAGESYGLVELQASVREIGLKHFPQANSDERKNSGFGMFFYLQVLAGLFEDAIAYLYPFSYIDAVHFGLALTYYGLLRPSDPLSACNELRSLSVKGLPQINFGRMIGYYTRDFRAAHVVSAVDYLVLISLNRDLDGEAGRRQNSLCHEALRDLVLETREFSKLIGDITPDGHGIRGVIEERVPLLALDHDDDFVRAVTLQAASFADENGRTTDAVLLYHLAGEYDTVVAIVSRSLSEAISLELGEDPLRLMPVKPSGNAQQPQGGSLSLAAIDDPVELARTMMTMYDRDIIFYGNIQDHNKMACRVLLEMSSIKKLVEAGRWAQALDRIKMLEILPLAAEGDASTVRAYAARFSGLSQPVAINVPNLLMWTVVCCVRQREQLTNGQFSGNEGTRRMLIHQLKQMTLDLTAYTSQLRYRFPPHLHEALARASAE